MDISQQEKIRVNIGIQCPECSGVQIIDRMDIKNNIVSGSWQCEECGCNWNRNYYKEVN